MAAHSSSSSSSSKERQQQERRTRRGLLYVPVLPIILGLGAIFATAAWFVFATKALQDTRIIAALISLPPPKAFATVMPALLAASMAGVVVLVVLTWLAYAYRARQQMAADAAGRVSLPQLRPVVALSGALAGLHYAVLVWFVVMFAITMLWLGGGMVAAKATMDGANTMSVVDQTLPRLIKSAMGIDPAKQGYLVHVAGRDVNIGRSSCSLFCFTLARAMLADTIDCTCNTALAAQLMPPGNTTADITDAAVCGSTPVMCSINAYAFSLYKQHMMPALAGIVVAVLCLIGLLMLASGTFARALAEQQRGDLSRCSSADADMSLADGGSTGPSEDGAEDGGGASGKVVGVQRNGVV